MAEGQGSAALVKARDALARLRDRVTALKGKGEEAVGETVSAAEVIGGAVAGGFVDEYWGTDDGSGIKLLRLHGVPANLLFGGLGKVGAFMGIAGKHGQHAHDIANGLLASYGVHVGRNLARQSAATAGTTTTTAAAAAPATAATG